jgi:hypothetical protein
MKNTMSLSSRCAARSRRSRALIILIGQHVLAESCVLDPDSCATPVVPELGRKGMQKIPSLISSKAPTRSTHTLVRDNSRPSRRIPPPSISSPLSSGQRGENHSHNSFPYVAPRVASVMCRSVANCFRHRMIRTIPPIPSLLWFTLLGGRIYGRCVFAITLAHRLKHSCRWWVPTRGEVG